MAGLNDHPSPGPNHDACPAPRHFFATEPPPSRAHQSPAMMSQWSKLLGEGSSRRRGRHCALANKRAAGSRARALATTIRELRAAGFISRQALADELNRAGIPTARGGSWHYTTVVRMLTRLGLLTSGKGAAADARAKALASTIRSLQAGGLVSFNAIAHALNEREIPTARGSKWHRSGVRRLLRRLKRLDRASNSRHRR
jgi:Recombinase